MRPSLTAARIWPLLGVFALAAPLIASCGGAVVCPAVGHISGVTLHVTKERAANLATLAIELCQDGTCRSTSTDPTAAVTAGAIPLPTASASLRGLPTRMADGSIDYLIEAPINDHRIDLTTSGTDTSGLVHRQEPRHPHPDHDLRLRTGVRRPHHRQGQRPGHALPPLAHFHDLADAADLKRQFAPGPDVQDPPFHRTDVTTATGR